MPIPGTPKLYRLQENNVAATGIEQSEDDLRHRHAASQVKVQRARYSRVAQRVINR